MIISRSYFKGIIDIPNAEDTAPNSNLLGNKTRLDAFIDEYEREILIDCLGYSLYREFESQLDPTKESGLKDDAPEKWNDLLNGKEYLKNDNLVKWQGIRFKIGETEYSLIAYYVFCEFLNNDLQNYSGVGVQKEKAKNSISVSADPLYVASFRKFFKLTEFSNDCKGLRSLYDFLQDSNSIDATTYQNWAPKKFKNINIFGI